VALPELTVISWRDIPAQVTATDGRRSARAALADRFMLAIDEAAMCAGLSGADDYLAEWQRETRECGTDLEREVADEVARLENALTPEMLEQLVAAGGLSAGPGSPCA
jgi:cvfA/B/C family virulence factor